MSFSKLDEAIFNIKFTEKANSLFSSIDIGFEGSKIVNIKFEI